MNQIIKRFLCSTNIQTGVQHFLQDHLFAQHSLRLACISTRKQTLCYLSKESLDVWLPIEHKAETEQPAHLFGLIWVIAWWACSLVGNAEPQLIYNTIGFFFVKKSWNGWFFEGICNWFLLFVCLFVLFGFYITFSYLSVITGCGRELVWMWEGPQYSLYRLLPL